MFQDIRPHEFHNQFQPREPKENDYVLLYKEHKVILMKNGEDVVLPTYQQAKELFLPVTEKLCYLLSVDDISFYLSWQEVETTDSYGYYDIYMFRMMQPDWMGFSGATAFHLAGWYDNHRYCGRCAAPMNHKENERALCCPGCGQVEYPKIAPVVMVGILDGNRMLLTRYAHSTYRRYALVAGFMEIGETLEDTVKREVMEEVGLEVKNLRYYKSQPWAFSESVLVGFFADIDGSSEINLDETELSEAVWVPKEELPTTDSVMSLTWDMIEAFRNGFD